METAKTICDTTHYDDCSYKRSISDANALYDAFLRAKQGSDWKPQVQKFEANWLNGLSEIQRSLEANNYSYLPTSRFTIDERGKRRVINGEQIRDRVTKHSLCDEVLTPTFRKYLIYDNGASVKGRGIDFTRKRLLTHLRRYYQTNKTNEGYILLMDYSKFYDNIRHDVLMAQFRKYVSDDMALNLLAKTLEDAQVDVSYMTDTEYKNCLSVLFNSLNYEQIDKANLNGTKMMAKHLNIGDQVAQIAGIIYPMPIDNYIKIVKGVKFYGRYMDDSYIIHKDKDFLISLLNEIEAIAESIGIFINKRKTRICKLSDRWRFLQIQYSLTDSGRIIRKINPKRVTAMRRRMKKLCGVLEKKEFEELFNSWWGNYQKLMSKAQRANMQILYRKLLEAYNVHN